MTMKPSQVLLLKTLSSTLFILASALAFASGPYTDVGIDKDDPRIVGWAVEVTSLIRGPQSIANPTGPLANFGTAANALGPAEGTSFDVVSLGDGGSITLTFDLAITDGPGTDFAVFENGFLSGGGVLAELAHVEVSSNGIDFVRFPSVSLTQTDTQVGGFGVLDPTNIYNLAGKHVAGRGTEFDLSEVAGLSPLVDVSFITHVRIVDVVGSIDPQYASYDSRGVAINDPWPTPFGSSGFDLDAVAVMNAVPEPGTVIVLSAGLWLLARRRRRA